MKTLARYALITLGSILIFGAVVPVAMVARIDFKEVGFFVWLATLIFIGAPLGIAVANLGMSVIRMANEKHPKTKAAIDWFDGLKKLSERALARFIGFISIVSIALACAYATGWWDLLDPKQTTHDWQWYNFLGLVIGGAFSSVFIYHAIKILGKSD